MIKFEHTEVFGWDAAIRGMRNPMNSWDKMDSISGYALNDNKFEIGPNDYDLMKRLRNAGTDHRKFMRMLVVYVDITAPMYWWKEFDTYKVGTVRNSCSTMHKIHAKEFCAEDFSIENLGYMKDFENLNMEAPIVDTSPYQMETYYHAPKSFIGYTIKLLNECRDLFLKTNNKAYWWQMIQLLPSSYNQKATVMLNYEVLSNIYKSRRGHKLNEWHVFCDWIESLPYSEFITGKFDEVHHR